MKAAPTPTIATDQASSASPTTLTATTAANTTGGTTAGAKTTAATTQAAMTAANTTCGTTAEATTTEAAMTHVEPDLWRPVILATLPLHVMEGGPGYHWRTSGFPLHPSRIAVDPLTGRGAARRTRSRSVWGVNGDSARGLVGGWSWCAL